MNIKTVIRFSVIEIANRYDSYVRSWDKYHGSRVTNVNHWITFSTPIFKSQREASLEKF